MEYKVTEMLLTNHLRPRTPLKAIGMVLHETASPNGSAMNHYRYFQDGAGGRLASANAFIDPVDIIVTIPFSEVSWHAGRTANNNYIGVELCHYEDAAKFSEIYKRAVSLFADTFVNKLKITTVTKENLMSHAEVSAKWHETNHTDPVDYFAKMGKTVDGFRADVQAKINQLIAPPKPPVVETPKPTPKPEVFPVGSVKFLQTALNKLGAKLVVDGIAGRLTLGACPLLQKGSKGDVVKFLQYKVGADADGDFGNITKGAVINYQKRNGLVADGLVGQNTWRKILGL